MAWYLIYCAIRKMFESKNLECNWSRRASRDFDTSNLPFVGMLRTANAVGEAFIAASYDTSSMRWWQLIHVCSSLLLAIFFRGN
jgi:hypothetical protein